MNRIRSGRIVSEHDPDGVVNFRRDDWSQNTKILVLLASCDFSGKGPICVLVIADFLVNCAQIWAVRPCEDVAVSGRRRKKERERVKAVEKNG